MTKVHWGWQNDHSAWGANIDHMVQQTVNEVSFFVETRTRIWPHWLRLFLIAKN